VGFTAEIAEYAELINISAHSAYSAVRIKALLRALCELGDEN
jgi:hypothetical protein